MDSDLKEWVKRNGRVTKEEERFSVYELNTTLREDEERKIREVSVGPENDREVKTVLMVGESGAGKTTFLNAFLNVVFGVDMDDDIRLQLKEQSPNCHTAFLFHHQKGMPYPFNYKVVDTLGLGDDDQANVKALKDYLSDKEAISHLNSVALIWKSSSRRLDERSQQILSKVKKLMSPDLESLTDVLLTFSPHDDSSAIDAIENTGVAYHKVFYFENAAFYQCPGENRRKIHETVWSSTMENHKKFLEELNQKQFKSLDNTTRIFKLEKRNEDLETKLERTETELNRTETELTETKDALRTSQGLNEKLIEEVGTICQKLTEKEMELENYRKTLIKLNQDQLASDDNSGKFNLSYILSLFGFFNGNVSNKSHSSSPATQAIQDSDTCKEATEDPMETKDALRTSQGENKKLTEEVGTICQKLTEKPIELENCQKALPKSNQDQLASDDNSGKSYFPSWFGFSNGNVSNKSHSSSPVTQPIQESDTCEEATEEVEDPQQKYPIN